MPDYPTLLVLTNPLENLLVVGEAATLLSVGIDYLIVDSHFEDATMPFLHIHRNTELVPDFSRQTGGPLVETSFNTVSNLNVS